MPRSHIFIVSIHDIVGNACWCSSRDTVVTVPTLQADKLGTGKLKDCLSSAAGAGWNLPSSSLFSECCHTASCQSQF